MGSEGMQPEENAQDLFSLPEPAIEEIASLVQSLPGFSSLSEDQLRDPDQLTSRLLGSFNPSQSREILTYFTLLNLGRLEDMARSKCAERFYLLHPGRLGERTLARCFQRRSQYRAPARFLSWAGSVMDEVVREAVEDGDLGLFSDDWEGCSDPPLRRRLQVIAQVNNNLPDQLRRISYLVFYDGRSAREIAKMLEYPLEQVEFILEQVFETVRRKINSDERC